MASSDFLIYDSSENPDTDKSYEHSKTNPFLFNKFASQFNVTFNYKNVKVESFRNSLVEFQSFLLNESIEGTFFVSETFKPDVTAKRLYNSADLYYVCLLVNNCINRSEYTFPSGKYRFVPIDKVIIISKFLSLSNANASNVRLINLEDDLTLFK